MRVSNQLPLLSMLEDLRAALSQHDWSERDTPPVVDFHLYFDGNVEEESIAPNQWGFGRPPIAALYDRFKAIAARADVERVMVGLHHDWRHHHYDDSFPPAENVHIFSSATPEVVESWLEGLECDGVIAGWPYGKPKNAPEPGADMRIHSVCWD